MHIVIAPDSFKECASALAIAEAIAEGVMRADPAATFDLVPMADGGEGTVDALVSATGGAKAEAMVMGPLGEPVVAEYGLLGDGQTAVIEMAAAAGLHLVPNDRRDPRATTTYGVGEVLAQALECAVSRIIIGIGGSATNDCGAGMAQALGFHLLDKDGKEAAHGGAALARVRSLDATRKHPKLGACEILVACDVDNPLCGPRGASEVFGPQKGADADAVKELDAALASFAKIVEKTLGVSIAELPGAGAAGGLGGGLVAFCGAKLVPGANLVAETIGLEEKIAKADLVITGEGKLDGQTASGKTPAGVARIAKANGVPCIALAGCVEPGYEALYKAGITAAFPIASGPVSLAQALKDTPERLAATAEAVLRVWNR